MNAPAGTPFSVGHARADVTPPVGTHMAGYASREEPCRGTHDPLTADAVAVSDGGLTVLLVALDVCFLGPDETAALKGAVGERTGLGPEAVLVNSSHTHAGPAAATLRGCPSDGAYLARLCEDTARAAGEALEDMRPAAMAAGAAPLDIGCNRRERDGSGEIILGVNPAGPRLGEVTVWRLARDGAKDVVLFSAPIHGTTAGAENLLMSSEWMGAAVRGVEEADAGVAAVFLQGCAGDQNPYRDERSFERMAEHGTAARDAALAALAAAEDLRPLPMANVAREVALPCEDGGAATLAVHGVRLGEAVLVGLGGEAFVEYALFGRDVSKARSTLVLGYTDGMIGYLPTEAALAEGGYETIAHRYFPGGRPLAGAAESAIRSALRGLVEELMSSS